MKCAILRPTANGTNVIKFEDPITCLAAEQSGDTVIYYGYEYDLVAETIPNTAGVKRKFLGNAKFTTTNVGGTFGGLPTGTTVKELTSVAVDCAIADVPIALPVDLVQTTADKKVYKKNAAGTAWTETNALPNVINVDNTMTAAQIQAVIDAATAGQVIKFAPGIYALGSSALVIKNGVHLDCSIEGSVVITSSNVVGTLHDNNVAAALTLSGFPSITNTGGFAKRIVLQNASSFISGFFWKYKALLTQTSTNAPTAILLSDNFSLVTTLTREGVGIYKLSIPGGYVTARTFVNPTIGVNLYFLTNEYVRISYSANDILIETFDSAATYADGVLDKFPIEITTY